MENPGVEGPGTIWKRETFKKIIIIIIIIIII